MDEIVAFVEVQVVQFVLIVLVEMKIPARTAVAEGVHADYLLFRCTKAFLARFSRVV